MQSISWSEISRQDKKGNQVLDPQKLVDVLEKYRREIEDLKQRLSSAENDIRYLK